MFVPSRSNAVKFTDEGFIELRVFPITVPKRRSRSSGSDSPTSRQQQAAGQHTLSRSERSTSWNRDSAPCSVLRFEVSWSIGIGMLLGGYNPNCVTVGARQWTRYTARRNGVALPAIRTGDYNTWLCTRVG